ncbi:MAG: DEAD/DEAH box helicase [Bacteroidota bacterium]
MNSFREENLPANLLNVLDSIGFTKPTPIQSETLGLVLKEGQDILGTAQTGTGKTGAFAIPLTAKLLRDKSVRVVVLTPTRELAAQVTKVFGKLLSADRKIQQVLLIGGVPIAKQFKCLKRNPRLIIGTPGRINDHLDRGTLKLDMACILVLDETDMMLDMGFDVQIARIIERMSCIRQRLMFSATLPPKIERLAGKYLEEPARISIGRVSSPHAAITQETIALERGMNKYQKLLEELETRKGSIIIFVQTRNKAAMLADQLKAAGCNSIALHGQLSQPRRKQVLMGFREEKYRLLVATDVASRGLDVPHVRHVINYDLPQCAEDYIHRIGRTARAGQKGSALSFLTKQNRNMWEEIQELVDPSGSPKRTRTHRQNRGDGFKNRKRAKGRRFRSRGSIAAHTRKK